MDRSFKICITFTVSDFVVRPLLAAGGPYISYIYSAQKRRQGDMVDGKDDVIKRRKIVSRIFAV